MPLVIQNDESSQRLQRQFRIVGRTPVVLDEVIVPTTDIGDFAGKSPFEARFLVGDSQKQGPAGAGTYSGVYITPGAGSVLVVERLLFASVPAGGLLQLMLYRPADVAAVTTVGTSPAVRLNGRMLSTGFAQQSRCTSSVYHHTSLLIGAIFGYYQVIAGENHEYPLSRGVHLDGSDPAGPLRLAVQLSTANVATPYIGFEGVEYIAP